MAMSHRVLAIVTDPLEDAEPIDELRHGANGDGVEVRVIVPAVEDSSFRHTLGDVDGPVRHAESTLEASIAALRHNGVAASGAIGDADPVLAAQDALREAPADEVLIFERAAERARWFENGLFDKARAELEPPLRLVVVDAAEGEPAAGVEIERTGPGVVRDSSDEVGSAYFPGLSRGDLAGMVVGVVGTIVAIVLAAAVGSGPGPESGWKAVAIGVAIATALINMAHVVGLTLFESVRYRGGFAKFFRGLALVATPAAVLVNLLILLFA
jgi:hypothetical protein